MNQAKPLISVLTPTWNRAAYLDRVWNGLNSQTYKNIEWIVCDDGSTDNTQEKISELRAKSSFPVTVISANVHIGKARMDNEAIAHACGQFILWNDSDDYLLPEAIEQLVDTWNSIPDADRKDYVGFTALCANENGVISTKLPTDGQFDMSWNELRAKFHVSGDMLYFTKSNALKQHKFPEVDFVVPEGIIWTSIGNLKTRVCPEVLRVVQYRATHCISFSNKMEYCRGRAYAIAVAEKNLKQYHNKVTTTMWSLITFIRCCTHAEMHYIESIKLWGANSSRLLFLLMTPIAFVFAIKDTVQRKVKKTHREFDTANKTVTITVDAALSPSIVQNK